VLIPASIFRSKQGGKLSLRIVPSVEVSEIRSQTVPGAFSHDFASSPLSAI
jgi:hypothetical protein